MSAKHKLSLTVQYPDTTLRTILTRRLLRQWVVAALFAPAELTLRFVDVDEAKELNHQYRAKDYATNVLTFAYPAEEEQEEDEEEAPTRADIVFCSAVLEREAAEQQKSLSAHAAHLVIHGVLHAQGYDHENADEAAEMEALEIEILAGLGVENPYASL